MAFVICLQVRERCPSLVRECHVLLPLLEEMEKHITAFYQALERASRITSAAIDPDTQTPTQQKQKWQVRYHDNERTEIKWLPGRSLTGYFSCFRHHSAHKQFYSVIDIYFRYVYINYYYPVNVLDNLIKVCLITHVTYD